MAGLRSSYATIGTAPSSRYHPSSAQLSSGFPSLSAELLPQINFATSNFHLSPDSRGGASLGVERSKEPLFAFVSAYHSIRESRGTRNDSSFLLILGSPRYDALYIGPPLSPHPFFPRVQRRLLPISSSGRPYGCTV